MSKNLLKLAVLSAVIFLGSIVTSCKTNYANLSSSKGESLKEAVNYNGNYLATDALTDPTFEYKYDLIFLSDDFLMLRKETYDKTNIEFNEKNYDINTTVFKISDLQSVDGTYYMTLTASSETVSMVIDGKEYSQQANIDKNLKISMVASMDKKTLLIRTSPELDPITFTYSSQSKDKK